jgi:NADPH:quinone reductase-like Zn-dependent oxidoreductase
LNVWTFLTRGDGIGSLERVERGEPVADTGQIVVRMSAFSLNYRNLLVIEGRHSWKPVAPRVPLSDGVGRVVSAGAGITRLRVGDRVAGIFLPAWIDGDLTAEKGAGSLGGAVADGVLSEYRVFDQEAVVRVPEHLSDAEASTLPVAAVTAWHAVRRRSDVRRGDVVLIEGTGGVSLFALQFARALGAETIVLSSSDEKLERLGGGINYSRHPDWESEVLARTGGRGVDHVIEVVGGENLNRALRAVRVSGSISFIGLIAGLSAPIDTWQFVAKNVHLHGIETGSREMFEEMNAFIADHSLRPSIDRTCDLERLPDALRRVASGSHFGKVVIGL